MTTRWLTHQVTMRRMSRRAALSATVAIAAGGVAGIPTATADDESASVVKHIVAFRYRPTVTPEQKTDVLSRFLALENECTRDGRPYILSIVGGDCTQSLEGLTGGFEQAFIVSLANRDDYRYYVGRPYTYPFDPVHDAFKAYSLPLLSVDAAGKTNGAMVFDFDTTTT
jgi:hypothetical protein